MLAYNPSTQETDRIMVNLGCISRPISKNPNAKLNQTVTRTNPTFTKPPGTHKTSSRVLFFTDLVTAVNTVKLLRTSSMKRSGTVAMLPHHHRHERHQHQCHRHLSLPFQKHQAGWRSLSWPLGGPQLTCAPVWCT